MANAKPLRDVLKIWNILKVVYYKEDNVFFSHEFQAHILLFKNLHAKAPRQENFKMVHIERKEHFVKGCSTGRVCPRVS